MTIPETQWCLFWKYFLLIIPHELHLPNIFQVPKLIRHYAHGFTVANVMRVWMWCWVFLGLVIQLDLWQLPIFAPLESAAQLNLARSFKLAEISICGGGQWPWAGSCLTCLCSFLSLVLPALSSQYSWARIIFILFPLTSWSDIWAYLK